MKRVSFKYLLVSTLAILLIHQPGYAQEQFKMDATASKLTVSGTSTVHDWEIEAEDFNCEATISVDGNSIADIRKIDFVCPVENLKSGNKLMDNKTYKALNSNKYPEINFQVNNSEVKTTDKTKLGVKGTLTINNTKKELNLVFTAEPVNDNTIKVKGEVPLKMSDFGIVPPTAMMGTMKTGDDIKVTYEILLKNIHETN
jgi:polyisoprenoid-binding protein YceI